MTLGDVIKSYRKAHSMSMADFGKLSGLSKAYVGILEKNVNPTTQRPVVPSIVTIKAVSLAIGMDMDELIAVLDGETTISLDAVDKTDFELMAQEIFDEAQQKYDRVSKELSELAEQMSHLDEKTIDKLLALFKDQVSLHYSLLKMETESID